MPPWGSSQGSEPLRPGARKGARAQTAPMARTASSGGLVALLPQFDWGPRRLAAKSLLIGRPEGA